ncbi:MAG: hypothetical protein AB7F86_06860 [Bdellovibrionales bacterium]
MDEQLDPEMLANLDLLVNMDVLESESDWDWLDDLDSIQKESGEESSHE